MAGHLLALYLLAAACAWGAPGPGPASSGDTNLMDLSVEQLMALQVDRVSGASRYEQEVARAPASVSILTTNEIQKLGYRTWLDMLQGVRGMYVTSDRNYPYLGIRGFGRPGDYNSRLLLLVDGHRMNDNIYSDPLSGGEETLDVDLIDRVEIIRGPSSSVYGDNAFFGVINVVTKRGRSINGVEASVEAGSLETYKGRFTLGKSLAEDLEFLLSGSWLDSRGASDLYYKEYDDPTTNYGVADHSDRASRQSLFASLRWGELTLSGGFVNREKEVPTASYDTIFNSGLEHTTDRRGYVDLRYEHDLGEATHLMARAYYDVYSFDGNYPYEDTNGVRFINSVPMVMNLDEAYGDWVGTEWQLNHKVLDRHMLIAGVDYRENLTQHQRSYYDEPGLEESSTDQTGRNVGLYGQAEVALRTNLTLNAGLRYDYYTTFGETLNPRLGLIYSPWHPTTLKLLYGRAFRTPNVYESYYESPNSEKANPDLQPETINTYELVVEQQLLANLSFSVSGYYYRIDDLISQQTDSSGLLYFANVDQVEGKGVELELDHHTTSGWRSRISYACQRAEDRTTGEELSNSPRHLVKASVIAPIYRDRLYTGLELLYTSSVRTLAGAHADDFAIVNWTLFSHNVLKNLDLSVTVYNLFDIRYGYPGAAEHRQDVIDQDGLGFRVKMTYRF